jgi:ATP phosphoribosyltransferase regulatory subunit
MPERLRIAVPRGALLDDTLALLESLGVERAASERILAELAAGDFVGVERRLEALPLSDEDAALLVAVPRMRGGPELLSAGAGAHAGPLQEAARNMREVLALLSPRIAARVIVDFGLVRNLGYYTGAVFQVYDPGYGLAVGSGGRYDDLLGKFGRPLPAVGFALDVERVHIALAGEERHHA